MPEQRKDAILGHTVLIAPERLSRPMELTSPVVPERLDRCPFCCGNEEETPDAVAVFPDDAMNDDWSVRVVPNRYPAVGRAPAESTAAVVSSDDPDSETDLFQCFQTESASGYHEVIIESPVHYRAMRELPEEQLVRVVRAWRERLRQVNSDRSVAHTMIFRNEGASAGASLEHVHSQLLATSFIPELIDRELTVAYQHFDSCGRGIWADALERELADGSRIVAETPEFVLFCPFASRFPGELCLLPRTAMPLFESVGDGQSLEVASLLHRAVRGLQVIFPGAAFNLGIHSAPPHDERQHAYHWHLQIAPRITGVAGFELTAGGWINVVTPEDAAERYRHAKDREAG